MAETASVALRYDRTLPAPFVVASGRGELASRIAGIAEKAGIPVRDDPELAARLVCLDPGTVIPEELFAPVAEILAFVLALDGER